MTMLLRTLFAVLTVVALLLPVKGSSEATGIHPTPTPAHAPAPLIRSRSGRPPARLQINDGLQQEDYVISLSHDISKGLVTPEAQVTGSIQCYVPPSGASENVAMSFNAFLGGVLTTNRTEAGVLCDSLKEERIFIHSDAGMICYAPMLAYQRNSAGYATECRQATDDLTIPMHHPFPFKLEYDYIQYEGTWSFFFEDEVGLQHRIARIEDIVNTIDLPALEVEEAWDSLLHPSNPWFWMSTNWDTPQYIVNNAYVLWPSQNLNVNIDQTANFAFTQSTDGNDGCYADPTLVSQYRFVWTGQYFTPTPDPRDWAVYTPPYPPAYKTFCSGVTW